MVPELEPLRQALSKAWMSKRPETNRRCLFRRNEWFGRMHEYHLPRYPLEQQRLPAGEAKHRIGVQDTGQESSHRRHFLLMLSRLMTMEVVQGKSRGGHSLLRSA
jgi:hypothetical protein